MPALKRLLLFISIALIAACDNFGPLPFPTPGQRDLVALVRPGPMTYTADDTGGGSGLEHDLIEAFAQELGVGVKFIVAQPEDFDARLLHGRYHIAAGWLSPEAHQDNASQPLTSPIFVSHDILVQHEASLPLADVSQLAGKTVHVIAGTRQAKTLRQLAKTVSGMEVVEASGDVFDLLEALGDRQVDYVAIDSRLEDIAYQYVPTLRTTLPLNGDQPIVWRLADHPNTELAARARSFIERIQLDGTLARLEERYFGHVRRLEQGDVLKFLGQIETTLPRLRKHFQAAASITGLDWRLIAAVAYQESHWDASATSHTNVRGIMMLTEETADRLGVANRLDARDSIIAGARYINMLKGNLPDDVPEPDKTWLALAAYNIGQGHLNAARNIARQLKADPNAWIEMKRILPLLAKPKYYQHLKSGRGRGGEAVILVENIRSYYDILVRNETATKVAQQRPGSIFSLHGAGGHGPGLRLSHR